MVFARILFLFVITAAGATGLPARAQEDAAKWPVADASAAPPSSDAATSAETPRDAAPAESKSSAADAALVVADTAVSQTSEVTPAAIGQLKKRAAEAEQLAEETRSDINALCEKALAKLTDADGFAATTTALQTELAGCSAELEALQKKIAEPKVEPQSMADLSADEVRARLSAADAGVSAARDKAQKSAAEIQRRAERRKVLPEALVKCREQLAKAEERLKGPAKDEQPLLAEARRFYQTCQFGALEKQLHSLQQETRTYEATARLLLARRDDAEKQLQAAVDVHKVVQEAAAKAQRREAERQAREARRAAVNAHPAVKEAAAKNSELAERNKALVQRIQQAKSRLAEVNALGDTMKVRLKDTHRRAAEAKHSPAIGMMLRSQQDQLPALAPYRERLKNRPVERSQLGLDVYEWRMMRDEALHVDRAVEATISQLTGSAADLMRDEMAAAEFAAELRVVLEARAKILAELISNADDCIADLEQLDVAATELVNTTEELDAFIAEHVLWVRSAPALSTDEFRRVGAFWSDVKSRSAQGSATLSALVTDAKQRPVWWSLAALVAVIFGVGRRRARRRLYAAGEAAVKPTATLFRPTVEATLATIFLALPVTVIVGFVGWRLTITGDVWLHAAGWAVLLFAAAYGELNLVRHASRNGGLGTHHFGWDRKALSAIRHSCRSLQLLALPLLAIAAGIEIGRHEASINALGRLSLIPALLVIGVLCFRLFRSTGSLATALATSAGGSWGARAVRILAPISLLTILGLIVASAAGYHYTAMKLTGRVFVSCVFVFGCLALRSLLMRWLLVAYRRVAMQRAREKRQALQAAQENASADTPVVEAEPQFSLSDINQQARRLVGVGAGLAFAASMWFFWADMLPALGVFNRIELWESGLVSNDPAVGITFVTLAGLITAIGIFVFTWFAGRNLPGLLEIAVLQKLPLDAGARYAASSVTRYAIMVVGVALGMRQLGIGWNSVQWLIAAMTVGLGFGLQEIFANFVSGIILLFERPARVGDTVTIGEITGAITKIRIRATTILDWDNKELVVPNKEFVTGNLVNWTLSNPTLRVVVKVGVAYGSNTRLATELLYRVAAESPNVLETPEPAVIFNEFGDSSLNFELRLFVSDLSQYRRLRHELHMAIDDAFREHGIEIAFPQCDLHVKSLPVAAPGMLDAQHAAA